MISCASNCPEARSLSTVVRGCNGGLWQPILWRLGTEQYAGDRRSGDTGIVLRQKVQVHQPTPRIRSAGNAEQGFPQALAQSLKARLRYHLLVEPEVATLCPSLRQSQAFIPIETAFARTHPDKGSPGSLVDGVALGHLHDQESPSVEFAVVDVDAHRRLHGVGTDFHEQAVQLGHLTPGHSLDVPVVGDTTQKHATAGVGECADLVRKVASTGADWCVAVEFDLLEFPETVLA